MSYSSKNLSIYLSGSCKNYLSGLHLSFFFSSVVYDYQNIPYFQFLSLNSSLLLICMLNVSIFIIFFIFFSFLIFLYFMLVTEPFISVPFFNSSFFTWSLFYTPLFILYSCPVKSFTPFIIFYSSLHSISTIPSFYIHSNLHYDYNFFRWALLFIIFSCTPLHLYFPKLFTPLSIYTDSYIFCLYSATIPLPFLSILSALTHPPTLPPFILTYIYPSHLYHFSPA